MKQKTERLYPSAPLEKDIDLEQGLEEKLNDVNSFNNHINNIKEVISYFKDKNHKSKKKNKNYKTPKHNIRIFRLNGYRRSNFNLNNSIDYWF